MTALVFSKAGVFRVPGHCERWHELNRQRYAAQRAGRGKTAEVLALRMGTHLVVCEQCQEYEQMDDDPGIQYQLTKTEEARVWEVLG